jgi:hypothetical protein
MKAWGSSEPRFSTRSYPFPQSSAKLANRRGSIVYTHTPSCF